MVCANEHLSVGTFKLKLKVVAFLIFSHKLQNGNLVCDTVGKALIVASLQRYNPIDLGVFLHMKLCEASNIYFFLQFLGLSSGHPAASKFSHHPPNSRRHFWSSVILQKMWCLIPDTDRRPADSGICVLANGHGELCQISLQRQSTSVNCELSGAFLVVGQTQDFLKLEQITPETMEFQTSRCHPCLSLK